MSAGGGSKGRADKIPLQKRYGQHHLVRSASCDPLIEYLDPSGRLVVEIGPGGGVLTERLVSSAVRVLAVEIDLRWALELGQKMDRNRLAMIVADAVEMDWTRVPAGTLVAGNLPFNVATALIERLLYAWRTVPRAAFLVQKEVADRLLAGPGHGAYGAQSVLTAARARPVLLGTVRRGSFRPPPKVDGAFVGLELFPPVLEEQEMRPFTKTVHLAFAQRRKQLRNALASGWGRQEADRVLAAAGIDPRRRAEALTLSEFLKLHEARWK